MLGNPRLYPQIEERLTELLGAPDTLVLPTITHIHMSVIPVLAGGGTVFVEDRRAQDHLRRLRARPRARRDAASASTPATWTSWRDCCARPTPAGPRLVCVDGVNSMTGNIPDLRAYARLCREHGALLYVDDAHGFGVIGERRADEAVAVRLRAATPSCATAARPTTTSCSSAASPRRTRRCWRSSPCRPR